MINLRTKRKEKGYTCESLGKMVNLKRATISKYELGQIEPNIKTILKLAKILDCSTDYLLGRDSPGTS